jgi:hydrogenase maturation protein HypF
MFQPHADSAARRVAREIHLEGIVQGVGFRPFVHGLATRLGLGGIVTNDTRGVLIEVEGGEREVTRFLARLEADAPPLAALTCVRITPIPARGRASFAIVASRPDGARTVAVSPDVATCADCLRELFDPGDRRHRYPFINCTNCGPRFTIVRGVPYDRPLTTMAAFPMCAACAREYGDPSDRRFHAEPISCPACGPRMRLVDRHDVAMPGDPVEEAAALLRGGSVVALKGLGGYHLAAAAEHEDAVAALRARKHREDKPFAVMVPDLAAARVLAQVSPAEAAALESAPRPIVLVRRRPDARVAAAVAPGNRSLGLMLPYTPVHHLLCQQVGAPLVLTSGNVSDEPIAYRDQDAFERLGSIADVFLTHDRPIHVRTDDSVVRVQRGRAMPIRRSRGYAPAPLALPSAVRRPILACGAELKSTFCLAKDRVAYVSHHIGDLENYETLRAFTDGIDHFRRLFDVTPEVVAHDLHPEYLSTRYALGLDGVALVGVQHHHAHIAACLADNGEEGPAIGVALDGLGFGADATLWGGEFLIADLASFERVAHLEAVPLPGGTIAIRQPWRMAAVYLAAALGESHPREMDVVRRHARQWDDVLRIAGIRSLAPLTSSAGRLFDAVAAILGVRDEIRYEGQAAVELEQRADEAETRGYAAGLSDSTPIRIRGVDLVRAVVEDLRAGAPVPLVAARFHNGLAHTIVEVCDTLRARHRLSTVALSGGVFQNVLLAERTVRSLEEIGFQVLTHTRIPCNDGGISFGQTVVAAARDRRPGALLPQRSRGGH